VSDEALSQSGWQPPPLSVVPESSPAVSTPTATAAPPVADVPSHEEARQTAQREGFTQGFEEGQAQAKALATQMQALLQALATPFAESDATLMREILGLTERVCRAVLHRELTTDSDTIAKVLADALDALGESHSSVELTLHPADALLCRELGVVANGDISIREDSELQRGGLLLRSQQELIDAQLETRLQAILEGLYSQAGLPEPTRESDDEPGESI